MNYPVIPDSCYVGENCFVNIAQVYMKQEVIMAKENRIGALWKPDSQSDKAPLGKGNIEINGRNLNIVVWPNRWKQEGEKTPDYYIELDVPREQSAEPPRPLKTDPRLGTGVNKGRTNPRPTAPGLRPGSVPHYAQGGDFADDIAF